MSSFDDTSVGCCVGSVAMVLWTNFGALAKQICDWDFEVDRGMHIILWRTYASFFVFEHVNYDKLCQYVNESDLQDVSDNICLDTLC